MNKNPASHHLPRTWLNIEHLEPRITPAAVFTFTDFDGDVVTVKTSKGTNEQLAAILTFSSPDPGAPRVLQIIDFSANSAVFTGTNLSVLAKRSPVTGGNGFANVGIIDAHTVSGGTATPLGIIDIDGSLGQIDAESTTEIPVAIQSVKSQSIGAFFAGTSTITGNVGSWTVKSDWTTSRAEIDGVLKVLKIGGSIKSEIASGGVVIADEIGSVFVGGSIIGSFSGTGLIFGTIMGNVTVGGSIIGRDSGSGIIAGVTSLGAVKVGGDLQGGSGINSGRIDCTIGGIKSVTIGGSVLGGDGNGTGFIFTGLSIGSVRIGGSLVGSNGDNTGTLRMNASADVIKSIFIGGSLVGGNGDSSGHIDVEGKVGSFTLKGSVVGAHANGSEIAVESGFVHVGRAAKMFIGGSLVAGRDATTGEFSNNGAIRVTDDIGLLIIKGGIYGNETNPALITARGQLEPVGGKDIALGKVMVTGSVEFARILAGYNSFGTTINGNGGTNADAQIGTMTIGGDFVASSIAAGINDLGDGFGNEFDTRLFVLNVIEIQSRIASVVIKGQVVGTDGPGDHFGIVAEEIASVTVGGVKLPLQPGPANDDLDAASPLLLIAPTGDVRVHEAILLP